MLARLERGLEGYSRISKHALSADASATLIAEVEDEAEGDGAKQDNAAG